MNPVFSEVMRKVPDVPGLALQMFRETEYDANPYELVPVGKVAAWTLGAALRGRPGMILHFLRQARRAMGVQREVHLYRNRLDAIGQV